MELITNYKHPVDIIMSGFTEQMEQGQVSPVQASEYMLRLEFYRNKYNVMMETYAQDYRGYLAQLLLDDIKLSKARAEIIAQNDDAYKMMRICKIELEHLEHFISQLKYYQRGIEKEWVNAKSY